jgi:hypothetical protein
MMVCDILAPEIGLMNRCSRTFTTIPSKTLWCMFGLSFLMPKLMVDRLLD